MKYEDIKSVKDIREYLKGCTNQYIYNMKLSLIAYSKCFKLNLKDYYILDEINDYLNKLDIDTLNKLNSKGGEEHGRYRCRRNKQKPN